LKNDIISYLGKLEIISLEEKRDEHENKNEKFTDRFSFIQEMCDFFLILEERKISPKHKLNCPMLSSRIKVLMVSISKVSVSF